MKDKKTNLWAGAAMALMVMSLTKMPYPIVSIIFSIGIIFILYCIFKLYRMVKYKTKTIWAALGALISVFMGYVFFFINRTIEEFNIWQSMKDISLFLGIFFIIMMIVMIFITAIPQIKKMGGFANMMEEQNPGSWFMMKIIFWVIILILIFEGSIFIWEHFFK